MNTGNFDTMVTIQQNTPVKDAAGTPVESWSQYCQMWVQLNYKSGGESADSDQRVGRTTYESWTHRYDGITQEMRAVVNGEYYDILEVDYSDRYSMKFVIVKKDNQ